MADSDILTFELPDGSAHTVRGWKGLDKWLGEFQAAWAWVRSAHGSDPVGMRANAVNTLDRLNTMAQEARDRAAPPDELARMLPAHFNSEWAPYHQDSVDGQRILVVQKEAGNDAGLFALALAKVRAHANQIHTFDHFRGAMLLAFPSLASGVDMGDDVRRERTAMRSGYRALLAESEAAEAERATIFETMLSTYAQRGIDTARRRSERTIHWLKAWRSERVSAISELDAVKKTYHEEMKLKSSVQYWGDKARIHKTAEGKARFWLVLYFPIAFLAISGIFGCVGYFLIVHAPKNIPSSAYFVATAGLAASAGILLWIGRLLTKLYLSEHHLRHDAEDRAVMTTTYLALTAEKAATEADRQIILTALFRTTSDGIVKEDGGLDPSLGAALAKYLSR